MSTGVIITLIICGTIVLLSVVSTIGKAIAAKKTKKTLDEFIDALYKEED